jgi:hypothetical protein
MSFAALPSHLPTGSRSLPGKVRLGDNRAFPRRDCPVPLLVISHGNPTGFTGTIVGVSVTADGQGYADVSSAGQVYAYGSVMYRGNA